MQYQFAIQDKSYTVEVGEIEDGRVAVQVNDDLFHVEVNNLDQLDLNRRVTQPAVGGNALPSSEAIPSHGGVTVATAPHVAPVASEVTTSGEGVVTAPIPGLILELKVAEGESVSAGQMVATMEAMKMENHICANVDGKVKEIRAEKGAAVTAGDVIMIIG